MSNAFFYNFIIFLTCTFYLLTFLLQVKRLSSNRIQKKTRIFFALIPLVLHGFLLYHWIDTTQGQNLAFFNVISQIIWFTAVLLFLITLRRPLELLQLVIYPLAALSIVLVTLFPEHYIVHLSTNPRYLIHVLLSIIAVSVLALAAFEAILLFFQEYCLRRSIGMQLLRIMPPMQILEGWLFETITIGFVLLSFVWLTAVAFFPTAIIASMLEKTVLVIIAWLIFAILLFGRYYFGWRGLTAIRWTWCGFILLILAYFGRRIVVAWLQGI